MIKPTVIETPYGNDPKFYAIYARKCMQDSIKNNELPIASHLLYAETKVLDENNTSERKFGMGLGHQWIDILKYVIFYIDFGWSKGMLEAYQYVIDKNIPFEERTCLNV